ARRARPRRTTSRPRRAPRAGARACLASSSRDRSRTSRGRRRALRARRGSRAPACVDRRMQQAARLDESPEIGRDQDFHRCGLLGALWGRPTLSTWKEHTLKKWLALTISIVVVVLAAAGATLGVLTAYAGQQLACIRAENSQSAR